MPSSIGSFELSVSLGGSSFSSSGKPDLVLKAFEDFKALVGHGGEIAPASAGSSVRSPARAKRAGSHESVPVQAFLSKLKLKGNAQIGAAILSWSAQHGENEKLTPSELHSLWEQTEFKPPSPASNTVRDLAPAVKKGWVKKEGKGAGQTFYAPAYGQKEVAKWTPDGE
jgi:hypothetical protein